MKLARQIITDHRYFVTIILLFIASVSVAFGVNAAFYHYPGNTYYPAATPGFFFVLCLIYAGTCLVYGQKSLAAQKARELLYLFLTMILTLVGCMAAQYTPFPPIDHHILQWSAWMQVDLAKLVQWTVSHPVLYSCLAIFYDSLTYQMTYLPLVLILFGQFKRLHEYYFLLLLTALIGYGFYYFFPTTAPASVIESPYFIGPQYATALKFYQIHAHIQPTTVEGGMVAFPSFHVIWAWLCVFLIRDLRFARLLLLILNLAITASCVLLGWHYILDVIASIAVIGIGHLAYFKIYPTNGTP